MSTQKEIILGITGGIAAYKACDLARLFIKDGYQVQPVMTQSATRFITPLTLSYLCSRKVLVDMFDEKIDWNIEHVTLADRGSLMLIAPATANIIAKIAWGIADDFVSLTALTFTGEGVNPLVIAPAMNFRMYHNPATRENIEILKQRGVIFIDPEEGELACGEHGDGRLAPVETIHSQVVEILQRSSDLKGVKAIVTAGGTREPIDPVRVISNRSSGKMGYSIVTALRRRGAYVTLLTSSGGPYHGADEVVSFETASDLKTELERIFPSCDLLVMAAAVSDYKLNEPFKSKVHRSSGKLLLELTPTEDIVSSLAAIKGNRFIVGFAAESEDIVEHAGAKLKSKGLDMIVANDISRQDIGFNSDFNEVTIIHGDSIVPLPRARKTDIASMIVEEIISVLKKKN